MEQRRKYSENLFTFFFNCIKFFFNENSNFISNFVSVFFYVLFIFSFFFEDIQAFYFKYKIDLDFNFLIVKIFFFNSYISLFVLNLFIFFFFSIFLVLLLILLECFFLTRILLIFNIVVFLIIFLMLSFILLLILFYYYCFDFSFISGSYNFNFFSDFFLFRVYNCDLNFYFINFLLSNLKIIECNETSFNVLTDTFFGLTKFSSLYLYTGALNISWDILFDPVTFIMLFVILSISFFVNIYSIEYMFEDKRKLRFFICLFLFTMFMLLLVVSNNFFQLFVGWEGVGLTSFLLINFWYNRKSANKAALKALIMNKIGDIFLLFGIGLIFFFYKTLDFLLIFSLIPFNANIKIFCFNNIDLICFSFAIAAIAKSAQFGLHTWLPDAMEGPTPVSALLHAATMVTAGVFLLIRISPILEYSLCILNFLLIIGTITILFAGSVASVQYDLKKIIAYSTCGQLGYMFYACGSSNYVGSLFHLFTHAYFKALLFLAAGSIIHALFGEQDIRKYAIKPRSLLFTYLCFLIGNLCLMGIPFFSGYYSKDYILEYANFMAFIAARGGTPIELYCFYLVSVGVGLTALYSIRSFLMVFNLFPNSIWYEIYLKTSILKENIKEPHFFMKFPLFFLTIFSIFAGLYFKHFFVCENNLYFSNIFFDNNCIFILPFHNFNFRVVNCLCIFVKCLPLCIISFVFYIFLPLSDYRKFMVFFFINENNKILNFFFYFYSKVKFFFNKRWFIDSFYNRFFASPILNCSYNIFIKSFERGFFEVFGSTGIVELFSTKLKFLWSLQKRKYFFNFIFYIVGFFVFCLFFLFFYKTNLFILVLLSVVYIFNSSDV